MISLEYQIIWKKFQPYLRNSWFQKKTNDSIPITTNSFMSITEFQENLKGVFTRIVLEATLG